MVGVAAETSHKWLVVAIILAIAAIVRMIAANILPDQSSLLPDVVAYRESAWQLFSDFNLTKPFQMPLYPLLIGIAGPRLGQLTADIALSVVAVWLIHALSLELFADRRAAIFAATAAAFYPPLIFFAVVGLSETLFITLILAAFLCWYRARFGLAAVFAVLAILTRPIFDLAAPALVVIFATFVHRLPLPRTAHLLLAYGIIYCVLLSPWWLHNYRSYGQFVRLTPGFGTVLYAGNNPLNTSGGGNLGIDYDTSEFQKIADPIERDRALRDAAIAYIRDHPKRFFELAGLKFIRMWRLWPANEGYTNLSTVLISIASFVPALVLSALGLFYSRLELRRLSPILLFGLGYMAAHMVLVGTIRYRLPLEPFLLIFAGRFASHFVRPYLSTQATS